MNREIKGLTSEEVKKSLELYGDNSLKKQKHKGFLKRFLENLSDPIIRVLMIALVLQVIFTFNNLNYFELLGIVVAILLSTTVSTVSEYRSERAFEKLEERDAENRVSVLRDNSIQKITVEEIVVGDVLYLSSGERVQADGTLISGKISVDQSALNGETQEVSKSVGEDYSWDLASSCKAFRGSVVTNGSAIMRVGRVGEETYYGMVARDVQTETRDSPLKIRLGKLASQISKIGYVAAGLVGIAYIFNALVINNDFDLAKITAFTSDYRNIISMLLHVITLMITVVVVAAPEGLPMMITVVLSANMKKMLSDNIMVKKLVGIETAGSLNILFTDKTGTITVGRLECDRIITHRGIYKSVNQLKKSGRIYEMLNISAKHNTDCIMSENELIGGNATDRAIYEFFGEEPAKLIEIKEKSSFTSERKESSVTLGNGKILIKGAAERILRTAKYILDENGESVAFDPSTLTEDYLNAVNRGERVLGVGVYENGRHGGLTLVGLIVLKDKIRKGVCEAVKNVTRAGIQIVMMTGDGRETAASIAEECGILNRRAGHLVISGEELRKMSDDEVKGILRKIRVISRALPQDKTRLVRLSQECQLVAGMTGDGINDAPSLKLSDVGFAMGSGTDIAKSAADIVILDNSFGAISKTILYGRTIFKSIRKFITFQLIMNLAACGVSLIGQFIGVDTPITIIQMLWVNIIMDTLGGLAFAGEPALDYYMQEKPKSQEEQILSREMLHQIFVTGAFTLLICILFLTSPVIRVMYGAVTPTKEFYTAFYALFIFLGIYNCLLSRCERLWLFSNIGKNIPFILIMLLISAIQICMIYFGGEVFRCAPLEAHELGFALSLGACVIPFEMIRRLIYKLK